MVTEPTALDTQADRLAQARAKQQQREAGIRAQAFGEGRKAERNDILKAAGAQTLEDISMLAALKEQHAKEMESSHRVHRGAARAMGAIYGACAAAVLVSLGFLFVVDRAMTQAFDRAQEIAAASTLVGAATQRRDEANR